MGLKILFICFIPFLSYQENDLSQFLNAAGEKIIYVKSFYSIIEQVKCEPLTQCPGIVIAVFSAKGEQLALNAATRYEATQYERFYVQKMYCVLSG